MKRTLAQRLQRVVDRGRDISARLGMRAYRVFLVWTWWEGGEEGMGGQHVARRVEISPIPRVTDLTTVTFSPVNAGVLPIGSIRIDQISSDYTQEQLSGLAIPCLPTTPTSRLMAMRNGEFGGPSPTLTAMVTESLPPNVEFFYEVVLDGRNAVKGQPARRERFRLSARPFLRPEKNDWIVVLERMSDDMNRFGGKPKPVLEDD